MPLWFRRSLLLCSVCTVACASLASVGRADPAPPAPAADAPVPTSPPPTPEPETPATPAMDERMTRVLLSGQQALSEQWVFVSGKKDAQAAETWNLTVQGTGPDAAPVLVCVGEPYGYLRTKQGFRNFELGLEWKYPHDDSGNSGVLIYTSGEDKIWPTAVQVQLHQPKAGSVFPSGGAKADFELRSNGEGLKPADQWNKCIISSVDGRISVSINDRMVGEVTGCDPKEGTIALQSEGSEVHFRNVWIRELGGEPSSAAMMPEESRGLRIVPDRRINRVTRPVTCPPLNERRRRELKELLDVVYGKPLACDCAAPGRECGLLAPLEIEAAVAVSVRGAALHGARAGRLAH